MTEIEQGRERLYSGRVVTLDLVKVTLPTGQTARREVIKHPGAVAIVPWHEDGTVTLVRQYRTAAGRFLLEIPAGTLEPNEEPEICAARELQEEAHFKPGKIESLGGIFAAPGYTTEYIHLFLASDLVPSELPPDEDEFIEIVQMSLADALTMIETGEICDAKTVVGLLRVARRRSS